MMRADRKRRRAVVHRQTTANTCSDLIHQNCEDPDDDKFFSAALASKTSVIISGDKHLLDKSGYSGITVLKPRKFLDLHFSLKNAARP
jgi:predicted nucleic acid-binding protein